MTTSCKQHLSINNPRSFSNVPLVCYYAKGRIDLTAFRLRDSLLPSYRFGSRWSGRGFTPAFFGGAPIKMSADILFKDRCSIQLSYGQFIF